MFELGKTPNVDKKSFVLVVNEFWDCVGLSFEEYCWLVLVWIGSRIYKRDQEEIVPLRLPNMGLKGGSGSSRLCPVLGVVVVFWP